MDNHKIFRTELLLNVLFPLFFSNGRTKEMHQQIFDSDKNFLKKANCGSGLRYKPAPK